MELFARPNTTASSIAELLFRFVARHPSHLFSLMLCTASWLVFPPSLRAADINEARAAFYAGEYDECIELTRAEVEKGIWNDVWSIQLVKTLVTVGRYAEAVEVYELVEEKFSGSIPLRVLAAEAYRFSGQADKGDRLLRQIPDLVQAAPWKYNDRDNSIAIGRYLLAQGIDAREILSSFYDRALKSDPRYVDAHLAIAELALEKADYQEAVISLDKALELRPEDPDVRYLLAKAWAPSDSKKASEYLQSALSLNPKHARSLLMSTRNLIDSEDYETAELAIEEVLRINAMHPQAWALRAAIAHLRGEYAKEGEFRAKGLAGWKLNPEVDHLIGITLSKHYRFQESAQYQERSLRMDPNFLPARFQLAQDLLRTGQDIKGWKIVNEVAEQDKYNVVAFNLKTLQERLAAFTTIEVPGFIIRMDAREAKIYGNRVASLLAEAKQQLCGKYEFDLDQPVTVEIFPQQSDFAIRTFGLPGGAGFLGVCFGSLITANSPASQGDTPSNWESVLWHEFCHVVTLQKTQNRMPRWLSEGISVYEELERNPSWGQSMTPIYKSMILSEDFVPLSELSGAFLSPKSPMHLQFAYFESALAVKYLIEQHGLPRLLKLLEDLGIGVTMEEAFARRFGDQQALDEDFKRYVFAAAENFLPGVDFEREGLPLGASPMDLQQWEKDHPGSYILQNIKVQRLIQLEKWSDALEEAKKLEELYPTDTSENGCLELLATIARKLQDEELEQQTLKKIVDLSPDNVPALVRLIDMAREKEEWESVVDLSERLLAVQPLITTGHEGVAEAARISGHPESAIDALRALKEMEPLDPASLHYQLADSLYTVNSIEEARREVLLALEYSPRYRQAQKLLVKIHESLHPKAERSGSDVPNRIALPDEGVPPSPDLKEAGR